MDFQTRRKVAGVVGTLIAAVGIAVLETNILVAAPLTLVGGGLGIWSVLWSYTSSDIRMETAVEEGEVPRMNFKYGEGVEVVTDSLPIFMHVINASPIKGTSWPQPVRLRVSCTSRPKQVFTTVYKTVNRDPNDPQIAIGERVDNRGPKTDLPGRSFTLEITEPVITSDRAVNICVQANQAIRVTSVKRST